MKRSISEVLNKVDHQSDFQSEIKKSKVGKKSNNSLNKTHFDSNEWVSASSLRNYMINDPILDWLKLKKYGLSNSNSNSNSFNHFESKDEFTEFIMRKGTEFEERIYRDLQLKFGENIVRVSFGVQDIVSSERAEETEKLIKLGTPIIYNGVLHNSQTKTYGAPDLIVRSDWINNICPKTLSKKEETRKAKELSGKYHYRIIDIKFCCLHLKANGKNLLNSGSVPAYKAQVYVYSEALGKIQGLVPPIAYILGRSYTYKSKGEIYSGKSCYDLLGEVNFKGIDWEIVVKAKDAISWLKDLKREGHTWNLYPKPNRIELYPNMCNTRDSPYSSVKKEIAEKLGDITQIWQCGPIHRQNAFDSGIYSWRDTACNSEVLGHRGLVIAPIVQKMLEFNRSNTSIKIQPDFVSNTDMNWHQNREIEFYLDCETISNVFDDFSRLPNMGGQTLIFLIGVGYITNKRISQWKFKYFHAKTCTLDGEKEMLVEFTKWLHYKIKKYDDHLVFHWSHADQSFLNSAYERHPDVSRLFLKFFDVFVLFKSEPILIKGVFNFGLKSIVDELSRLKLIDFKLSKNCLNGCDAMIRAWSCYQSHSNSNGSLIDNSEFKKIIQYNEDDCRSVFEIIKFLRNHHEKNKKKNDLNITQMSNITQMPKKSKDTSDDLPIDTLTPNTKSYNLRSRVINVKSSTSSDQETKRKYDDQKTQSNKKKKTDISSSDSSSDVSDDSLTEEDDRSINFNDDEYDSESKKIADYIKDICQEVIEVEKLSSDKAEELNRCTGIITDKIITVERILNTDFSLERKTRLVEKYYCLQYYKPFSEEYLSLQNEINAELLENADDVEEKFELNSKQDLKDIFKQNDLKLQDILSTSMSQKKKLKCIEKYRLLKCTSPISTEYSEIRSSILNDLKSKDQMDYSDKLKLCSFSPNTTEYIEREIDSFINLSPHDSEYYKKKSWLDFVLRIPNQVKDFPVSKDTPKNILQNFAKKLYNVMNETCFGMLSVKEKIIDYVFKRVSNPNSNKNILALVGPAGTGKTTIAKALSKVLDLPLIKLSLGGASDESVLTGHSFTYVGAIPGQIMKGIVENKCLNPIIYLDEVDKTGSKYGSDEVSNALMHILDSNQNDKFVDTYVGFECDLSQVFWILTFNNVEAINPILRDRMNIIHIKGYSKVEKVQMAENYLIPEILKNLCLSKDNIIIPQPCIRKLIELVPEEEGVRNLQRGLENIFERINRIILTDTTLTYPYTLTENKINELYESLDQNITSLYNKTNGMYV